MVANLYVAKELFRRVSIFCIFRLCAPATSICKQDFEGFWPSIAFVMAKKLMNGSVVEFYPSVGFTQCNKLTYTFKLDSPLKSAWHLLGGGANVGLLTYRVVGSWLNPMLTSETVVGHDLTLTGNCAPTTVSTMTGANQDCVVGSWSRETGCSQACGPGMRTRTRYVVSDAKGTGLKCPAATCGVGCISQNVTCNGATDNPLLCNTACVAGANDCKCRPTGARCDGSLQCVDNTTCRSPSAPPLGCEGCQCRADFSAPCEFGLVCRDGFCHALERGCAGCVCQADGSCNLGLKCGGLKVCAFPALEGNVTVCAEGAKDCPCSTDGKCSSAELSCSGGFCRAVAAPDDSVAPGPVDQVAIIVGASIGAICCVLLAAGVIFGIFWWSRRDHGVTNTSNYDPAGSSRITLDDAIVTNSPFIASQHTTPGYNVNDGYKQGAASSEPSLYPSHSGRHGTASYPSSEGSQAAYPSSQAGTTMYPSATAYPSQGSGTQYPSQQQSQYPSAGGGAFKCKLCLNMYNTDADLQVHIEKRH